MCMHICVCIYMHVYAYMCMHICMYVYTRTRARVNTHAPHLYLDTWAAEQIMVRKQLTVCTLTAAVALTL